MSEKIQTPFTFFSNVSYIDVEINHGFWKKIQDINADNAIFHQWEMLEKTGCIDNFRIVSKEKEGYRKGIFYWDSDAHKWSEAAIRINAIREKKNLKETVEKYVVLMEKAQEEDGYLFTYNQFFFPGTKWKNLLIEHELYTSGHLIEAAVEYFLTTQDSKYLNIAEKLANLICKRFLNNKKIEVPGHQEIEIALIKLYRVTRNDDFLKLARQFIERRGKKRLFFVQMIKEFLSVEKRSKEVNRIITKIASKPEKEEKVMSDLKVDDIPFLKFRFNYNALTGKYMQHQKHLKKLQRPVGHSVRFSYFMTAAAMLIQEIKEEKYKSQLEKIWQEMVQKYMYVTGGIGSLPLLEGFGRAYELSNKHAYCETCASIGTVFWSNEMLKLTGHSHYADLIEWQLYNAILVSPSIDGKKYYYYNPMLSHGNYERKEWYRTACCPSNYSRTVAKIGDYIYSRNEKNLWINQYISNYVKLKNKIELFLESNFPWDGKVKVKMKFLEKAVLNDFKLYFRFPSWSKEVQVKINDYERSIRKQQLDAIKRNASGYNPFLSKYLFLEEELEKEAEIELDFKMEVIKLKAHRKVKENKGKIALTYGPLVYCFEKTDNPASNIPFEVIDSSKIKVEEFIFPSFGNIKTIVSHTSDGNRLVAIPYFLWGNRGKTAMQIWIDEKRTS